MMALFSQPSSVDGASVVRADKDIYNQGEVIRVHFTNAPGNDSDWMCIVPAGSPDTDAGDYKYMPRGLSQGFLTFDPRSPGQYEVRAYYNYRQNGYVVSGRYAFSVGSDPVKEEALAQHVEPIEPNNSLETNFLLRFRLSHHRMWLYYPERMYMQFLMLRQKYFSKEVGGGDNGVATGIVQTYYDHGWAYYRDYPSWHRRIPHDWRRNYSNHIWGGRPWNPPRINHGNLNNHWRGGYWRSNQGLVRPTPSRPLGGPTLYRWWQAWR